MLLLIAWELIGARLLLEEKEGQWREAGRRLGAHCQGMSGQWLRQAVWRGGCLQAMVAAARLPFLAKEAWLWVALAAGQGRSGA